MSQLRSRRGAARVHPEPAEAGTGPALQEPLLGDQGRAADDAAPTEPLLGEAHPRRRSAEQAELPWLLSAVWHALTAAWRCILALLGRLLQGLRPAPQLSLLQQERLERLRERAAVPYDADAEEHRAALRQLWGAAFPGAPFPPGIKAEQWKEMGWQSDDPRRDFRAAGFISLEALCWMAARRHDTFVALMRKQHGVRSAWEYPFAAGGVNVAFMLVQLLELHTGGSEGSSAGSAGSAVAPASAAARGFLPLLVESDAAFEELFTLTYQVLDAVWLEQGASYMQFPQVLKDVRQRLERGLASRATSLAQLQRVLMPKEASC